jgi:hypothetical protein
MLNIFCKVRNCRFKYNHTTGGHICGTCHEPAHGQVECRNERAKEALQQYINDAIPIEKQCNIPECEYKTLHTVEGHRCKNCKQFHSEDSLECVHNRITISHVICCPICRTENRIKKDQQKIFGLEQKCAVCLDNSIEVFFPQCGHTCVCYNCLDTLNKF